MGRLCRAGWMWLLAGGLTCTLPGAILGQGPPAVRRLSLEEAKQLALCNNKALQLARLNVEEKQHAASAAGKDYFPKVLGNVTYFRFNDNLGTVLTLGRKPRAGVLPPGGRILEAVVVNQNAALSTVFVAQPITK